jgi:mannose-6-phosphate isomerase-like protein (cupin superfamily)
MAESSPTWDFNPFMQLRYKVLDAEDQIACTKAEIIMSAKSVGPPLHYHPSQQEYFEILSGSLEFFIHDKWQTLHAGESITVPLNTPHTFKNTSENEVVLINTHEPALDFAAFMEKFYHLSSSGKLKSAANISTNIYLSMLWMEHTKELISVKPPIGVMRFFAFLGKILRYNIHTQHTGKPKTVSRVGNK